MSGYEALAGSYDALMTDGSYQARADFLERCFQGSAVPVKTVLDLGCGTGTIAWMLAERGYEVIATDASGEMLTQAMGKAAGCPPGFPPPLFVCQPMERLNLGRRRADAVVSTLDSLNYLTREKDLRETLRRVCRYLRPGGRLVFDVNTPCKFRRMDAQMYMDEDPGNFCVWRTFFSEKTRICTYQVDLFRRRGDGAWDRRFEEHRQRAWEWEQLRGFLTDAGFTRIRRSGDLTLRPPKEDADRWTVLAEKPEGPEE